MDLPSRKLPNPADSHQCIQMHPNASKINALKAPFRETNPPNNASDPLDARQYAAARLFVQGYAHGEIARHFGIHRTTLTRWRVLPAFEQELARLHRVAEQDLRQAWPNRPAPKHRPPPLEEWTEEDEKWCEEVTRQCDEICDRIFNKRSAS